MREIIKGMVLGLGFIFRDVWGRIEVEGVKVIVCVELIGFVLILGRVKLIMGGRSVVI